MGARLAGCDCGHRRRPPPRSGGRLVARGAGVLDRRGPCDDPRCHEFDGSRCRTHGANVCDVTGAGEPLQLLLDASDCGSLDGPWEFFPNDHPHGGLPAVAPSSIQVPGLWEAQGHLSLDGPAWYRRSFVVVDAERHWTLRFGAVMDLAEVYLNGTYLGGHDQPFTPFEFDVTDTLRSGLNTLEVR